MAAALHKMERRNDAAGEQYNDQTLLHLIPVKKEHSTSSCEGLGQFCCNTNPDGVSWQRTIPK
jgi:hypothetical protein